MSQDVPRSRRNVILHRPRTRLAALVRRPDGLWRDEAIADATRRVEALRVPYMEVLDEMIGQLELACCRQGGSPVARPAIIIHLADRIITLAETFGLMPLSEATKRLCDLVQAFEAREIADSGQIATLVRVVRLFGPFAHPISVEASENVLYELRRVLEHLGIDVPDANRVHDVLSKMCDPLEMRTWN